MDLTFAHYRNRFCMFRTYYALAQGIIKPDGLNLSVIQLPDPPSHALEEAIIQGGMERMRPILMTAITTILGMLPLALGGSNVGGAYYYPLARTVMGGLAASTVLTLMILPNIYLLMDTLGTWIVGIFRGDRLNPVTNATAAASTRS